MARPQLYLRAAGRPPLDGITDKHYSNTNIHLSVRGFDPLSTNVVVAYSAGQPLGSDVLQLPCVLQTFDYVNMS